MLINYNLLVKFFLTILTICLGAYFFYLGYLSLNLYKSINSKPSNSKTNIDVICGDSPPEVRKISSFSHTFAPVLSTYSTNSPNSSTNAHVEVLSSRQSPLQSSVEVLSGWSFNRVLLYISSGWNFIRFQISSTNLFILSCLNFIWLNFIRKLLSTSSGWNYIRTRITSLSTQLKFQQVDVS